MEVLWRIAAEGEEVIGRGPVSSVALISRCGPFSHLMASGGRHGHLDQARRLDPLSLAWDGENGNLKETAIAYLLWFFLGGFGAHRFYLGKTGTAVTILVISLISVVLTTILIGFVGLFAVGIWVLVDAFLIPGWIRAHNEAVRRQAYGVR